MKVTEKELKALEKDFDLVVYVDDIIIVKTESEAENMIVEGSSWDYLKHSEDEWVVFKTEDAVQAWLILHPEDNPNSYSNLNNSLT